MRWSQMHIPALREDPADAGAPSHRLLLRAGYARKGNQQLSKSRPTVPRSG